MKAKGFVILFIIAAHLAFFGPGPGAYCQEILPDGLVGMFERDDGGYFTLVDEVTQEEVTKAARVLDIGDQYIDGENRCWEVSRIEGDTVYVRKISDNALEAVRVEDLHAQAGFWARLQGLLSQAGKQEPRRVAIYCTHSDESYIPTSGTHTKEWGDVYKVGEALKAEFEKRGFTVSLSYNNHNPHDSQAYVRSRRTAAELLKEQPLVLIDVHRDAVPRSEYETVIEGDELAKIQLVVGQQNQNRDSNLEFAKALKARADKEYPGLVKGIFHAKGNYNQDLAPRSVLIEFGTHETSLDMATKAADLIADVLPKATGTAKKPIEQAATRSTGWIIALVIAAVIAFVVLNAVGWQGIRGFFGREFSSAIGVKGRKEEQDSDSEDGHSHGDRTSKNRKGR
ncbi:MAG: stage II sporulation protein P [Firmicutes bacterium]|jgi:stage II sporulation protein P|nr:stage II sporulation protein P [Bacillota bacterium]